MVQSGKNWCPLSLGIHTWLTDLCASVLQDPLLQWQSFGDVYRVVFQHSPLTCFRHQCQCQNSLLSKHRQRAAKASRWKTKDWVRGSVWHAALGCSADTTRESENGIKLASTGLISCSHDLEESKRKGRQLAFYVRATSSKGIGLCLWARGRQHPELTLILIQQTSSLLLAKQASYEVF